MKPVSYTHLDVYKRQVEASLRLSDLMYHTKQKNGGYFYARQGLPHGDLPVSYTHLDVYKRQIQDIL